MVAYLAVHSWKRRRRGVALVLCTVVVAGWIATIGTLSRGAWLALLITVVVLAAGSWLVREPGRLRSRGVAGLAVVAVIVGVLAVVAGGESRLESIEQRIVHLRQLGNEPRTHIWKAAWQMFLDHPISGLGLDCFGLAFEQYRTPAYWHVEWNGGPARAHSELLQVAATQGAVGLGGLILLTAGLAAAGRRALRRSAGHDERLLIVAVGAGLIGFYAQSLFGFAVAGSTTLMITYAAILSRLAGFEQQEGSEDLPAAPSPSRRSIGLMLFPGILIACSLFIGNLLAGSGEHASVQARIFSASTYVLILLGVSWMAYRGAVETADHPDENSATERGATRTLETSFQGGTAARLVRIAIGVLLGTGIWWGVYTPWSADRACRRGRLLSASGQTGQGVALLQGAASRHPLRDLYWVELGSAYERAAKTETDPTRKRSLLREARTAHARALQLTPLSGYLHLNLARTLAELARLDPPDADSGAVFAAFDSGLALDPHNAYLLREGARAALLLESPDRARDYAGRARQRYEYYSPCRLQLGILAMSERRWETAAAEFEAAIRGRWHGDEDSLAVAWINLASCRIALSRYQDALGAAQRAVEIAPNHVQGWLAKGGAHEMLASEPEAGSPELHRQQAIDAYRKALGLSPKAAGAQAALRRLGAPYLE